MKKEDLIDVHEHLLCDYVMQCAADYLSAEGIPANANVCFRSTNEPKDKALMVVTVDGFDTAELARVFIASNGVTLKWDNLRHRDRDCSFYGEDLKRLHIHGEAVSVIFDVT